MNTKAEIDTVISEILDCLNNNQYPELSELVPRVIEEAPISAFDQLPYVTVRGCQLVAIDRYSSTIAILPNASISSKGIITIATNRSDGTTYLCMETKIGEKTKKILQRRIEQVIDLNNAHIEDSDAQLVNEKLKREKLGHKKNLQEILLTDRPKPRLSDRPRGKPRH